MNKNELIKKPNIRELKELIEKYNISEFESIYLINADMFYEWYKQNRNRSTYGGKVSSLDLAGAIEIFEEEIRYVTEPY